MTDFDALGRPDLLPNEWRQKLPFLAPHPRDEPVDGRGLSGQSHDKPGPPSVAALALNGKHHDAYSHAEPG